MDVMEKRKKFLINLCYYVVIIAIAVLVFRYVIAWCLPFVLGFGIAAMLQGAIKRLASKLPINSKVITIFVLILFYVIIGTLVVLLSIQIIDALIRFVEGVPAYFRDTLQPAIETLFSGVEDVVGRISPDLMNNFEDVNGTLVDVLKSMVPQVSSQSFSYLTSFVSFVPSFLLSFIFMIISSFFFALDFHQIIDFIMLQFSDKTRSLIRISKGHTLGTIGKFLKSYGIIMTITFIELSIGLSILRIDNAIAVALVIAMLDILPVLGTGGIMIPWGIIMVLNGQVHLGIALFIVYGIITVIRNIIEPKIVGGQVGAHPIVMLLSMFLGVNLLGIFGIFLLPMLVILIKNLNEDGVIHLYKMRPKEAYQKQK